MNEGLIKWLAERRTIAFLLSLIALVALCGAKKLDSGGFATSFAALIASFMASMAYTEAKKPDA